MIEWSQIPWWGPWLWGYAVYAVTRFAIAYAVNRVRVKRVQQRKEVSEGGTPWT
jgi:hypothetical protein